VDQQGGEMVGAPSQPRWTAGGASRVVMERGGVEGERGGVEGRWCTEKKKAETEEVANGRVTRRVHSES
jgi:hypothetical protein